MYIASPLVNLFNMVVTQVAKNLATTYGDKAPEVAKLASLTGRRWPVVGQLLHTVYTYIHINDAYYSIVIMVGIK